MSKRIAVLVSGGGTNLQALIDAQGRGELVNGRISAVISSTPDAFALERAKNTGIPGYVLPRRDFSDSRGYTAALTRLLRETVGADLVVMAGFMTILTEELFQAYPNAVINIHPSLIPSFCGVGCYGLHVHEKALEYGVKISGATVHFVTEECDAGPIILQKAAEVLPGRHAGGPPAAHHGAVRVEAAASGRLPLLPGPAEGGGPGGPHPGLPVIRLHTKIKHAV